MDETRLVFCIVCKSFYNGIDPIVCKGFPTVNMTLVTIVIAVGFFQSNTIILYDSNTLDAIIFDAGGDIGF